MTEVSIKIDNVTLDIEGWYSPGESGLWTHRNGDPGYPEVPPSFEIESIYYEGKDVTQLIMTMNDLFIKLIKGEGGYYTDLFIHLEELCLKKLEN